MFSLQNVPSFNHIITLFQVQRWKRLTEADALINCTINCSVAVLSSVYLKAASVKDKHKTQILKSLEWLHRIASTWPWADLGRERVIGFGALSTSLIAAHRLETNQPSSGRLKKAANLCLAKLSTFGKGYYSHLIFLSVLLFCSDLIGINHFILFYWDMLHKYNRNLEI